MRSHVPMHPPSHHVHATGHIPNAGIGCGVFASLLIYTASTRLEEGLPQHVLETVRHGDGLERWPLYVFLASALFCLFSSAVYHLCGTVNERWYILLGNWDYAGIGACPA